MVKISEVSKILNLINNKNGKPMNHVLRYWEKEFKKIKPKIINKRRYYSTGDIELLKLIKFLLKENGMTINGVKNVLKSNINKLDDYKPLSLQTNYFNENIRKKSNKILEKIKKLKTYGKKNSY